MKRGLRLSQSADVKGVRRKGRAHAHPFVVLFEAANGLDKSRIAVSAGKGVGNAVQRNRAKRVLKAAISPLAEQLEPGYDILLQARVGIRPAKSADVQTALKELLRKARLLRKNR